MRARHGSSLLTILIVATGTLPIGSEVRAAAGDVYARGTRWCASTHPNHGTLPGFGPAVDLNGEGDDFRWPIYAPGAGRVRVHSTGYGGGWGNSVIWISADRREEIHLAHLDSFGRTGRVRAGDVIGRTGNTGRSFGAHIHASARLAGRPSRLVLMGRVIEPGVCYRSIGPVVPTCLGRPATIVGTRDDDRIRGTRRDDVIVALEGDDVITAGAGDDRVCAAAGDDVVRGGLGDDRLVGAGGGDRLAGGAGTDLLIGGGGDNVLVGGGDADRLVGGRGPDVLGGGAGSDLLRGQGGDDAIDGGAGADRLLGGTGSDVLAGDDGNDVVLAGEADDLVAGGPGADWLDGGPGRDAVSYVEAPVAIVVSLAEGAASGWGDDQLTGIEDAEGSRFDDVLDGDDGDNRLWGGEGDDMLDGRSGHDPLDGGAGTDVCVNGDDVHGCEVPLGPPL